MKILVTGSKGMLGTDLIEKLNESHEVIGVDIDEIDITDLTQVENTLKNLNPDAVINCAAYTDVNGCETEVDLAYKVNALGVKNLAIICNEIDAVLMHISTDYIFDGKKGEPYIECDFPNPLSVYGKSKYAGEENIKTLTNKFFILRTQWLYGKNGKNFVKTMLSLAKSKTEISVISDQFGSPTYTKDLAEAVAELITTKEYGVYHITNSGVTTWYGFTSKIFELAGINSVKLNPCITQDYPTPATRPAFSPLKNYEWELSGRKARRSYEDALAEYLKEELL